MDGAIRRQREELEFAVLSGDAAKAAQSKGRSRPEEPCPVRTCFQRDIDRIVHSKAFRRLKHKTQVFLQPEGDHYRTRMTHTIEVMRLSRTVARALRLNEDLTEAIAWGHDLGHTPFGHAGERALAKLSKCGFEHNEQSMRIVDKLERNGRGLNLCYETKDGIIHHTGQNEPQTLEGRIVRLADRVAYVNHDLDDAIRAGILSYSDIPDELSAIIGDNYSQSLNAFINDIVNETLKKGDISLSPGMYFVLESFRAFMFERVYFNPVAKSEETKVYGILEKLFTYFVNRTEKLPEDYRNLLAAETPERVVVDYIAGMTDQYAISVYNNLFIPKGWLG